ncbi:plasma membrane localization protein, partial [Basidiobolus ranarum]
MVRSVTHLIFTKHAKLIENCYPRQTTQKGPKPSETSYLIFYASSRPVKLLKVARYLEKRVAHDANRRKLTDVEVSLAIWNELLRGCTRDVNLFAKGVLNSITMVLKTEVYDSMVAAVQTFCLFCSTYDGSSLGIDNELSSLLEVLLAKYSEWCQCLDTSPDVNRRMRILGLRALSSFVSSPSGKTSYTKKHLGIILPSFLCNIDIAELDVNLLNPANDAKISDSKPQDCHSIDSEETADEDINELALSCLKTLLNNANAANVGLTSRYLFRYLDENDFWNRQECAVEIVHYILNNME